MRTLVLAGLLAATAFAARAEEDSTRDANRNDVRCVIGMSVMSRNEQYKSWGTLGVFFYSGRIEGRTPGFDLAEAIKREVRQIPPASYNEIIQGCNATLGDKSRAFEAMKPPAPRGVGR
jgi:hypothetical protein